MRARVSATFLERRTGATGILRQELDQQSMNELAQIHESRFTAVFVRPERRDRFEQQLSTGRGQKRTNKKGRKRAEILANLEHWVQFERVEEIPLNSRSVEAILQTLRAAGSPERCYVISECEKLDAKLWLLEDIVKHLDEHAVFGTIISCEPGRLAYYSHCESEGLSFILRPRK